VGLSTAASSGVGVKTFSLPSAAMGELGWKVADTSERGAVASTSMKSTWSGGGGGWGMWDAAAARLQPTRGRCEGGLVGTATREGFGPFSGHTAPWGSAEGLSLTCRVLLLLFLLSCFFYPPPRRPGLALRLSHG